MNTAKAFVLLSGGIDSTTCLYQAYRDYNGRVTGVSIDYGQRHKKEIEYAQRSCQALMIPHKILDVSSIVPRTMLTDTSAAIPNVAYSDIKGVSPTYVPFRNGLLLAALTSYVVGEKESGSLDNFDNEWAIYFGAHAEDAQNWAYPDCTVEFTGAMANAIYVGTYRQVRLHTPLQWLVKSDIIRLGQHLGVAWGDTWSCYVGDTVHCGVCPTCRARRVGFLDAGVFDPTVYGGDVVVKERSGAP